MTGMQRTLLACVLAAAFCAIGVAADNSFLPGQFGEWQAEAPAKTLKLQDLGGDWANSPSGGRVLQEAGLTTIEERAYKNGADEVMLRVFALKDPSSAFEVYTFLLTPGMADLGLGAGSESAGSGQEAEVLVGNLVVQAELPAHAKPGILSDAVAALKAKADSSPLPPLKGYLPEHWRVFGSEKYALGPEGFRAGLNSLGQDASEELSKVVGFQNGVEAMLANYKGEHGSGILLLLEYPTPQLAEQHLHHIEQELTADAKKAGVTVERKASLLSLVFAPTSAAHAQAIRDEVKYETSVTWNEARQTATDPPIVSVMVKIFLFTGLFLGVATGLGIAFGGVRILVKRLFPGKVFDRPQDIEVLQMGLSGKKIDPTDMY
jgi:hypothetical protein